MQLAQIRVKTALKSGFYLLDIAEKVEFFDFYIPKMSDVYFIILSAIGPSVFMAFLYC